MAANWKSSQGIVSLGKRAVNQIWTAKSSPLSLNYFFFRRAAYSSVYEKNLDDHIRPSIASEDVIQQASDKYWAPHPETGVFEPASSHNPVAGSGSAHESSSENSVLEENAWFRPTSLEDVEKPPDHH